MAKGEIIEKVNKFIELVNAHYKVEMALLFGSFVRGEEHDWSDIDLALILDRDSKTDYYKQLEELYFLKKKVDDRIEPKIFYLEEYNDREEASFLSEIIRTGEIVYQKNRAA